MPHERTTDSRTTSRTDGGHRPARLVTAVIAAAALLGASLAAMATAGAVAQQANYTLTGSTTLGTQAPIAFPAGSGWSADIDDTTGAITNGMITVPASTIEPVPGVPVGVTFTDAAPATGQFDSATGQMDVTGSFDITLSIAVLSATCTIGPLDVSLSTENAGGSRFTGDPATGTLTAVNFTVPALAVTSTCPQGAADAINTALGLPTGTSNLTITLVATDQPVPPTSTTTAAPATTTTVKASPAPAANTSANFTG
ncbi:MAG: hypothetical protein ACXWCM_01690 [Acidimicrobiales bacterium]